MLRFLSQYAALSCYTAVMSTMKSSSPPSFSLIYKLLCEHFESGENLKKKKTLGYCPALEFYHYMKLPELRVRSVDPWIVDFRKNVKYTENQFLIRFFGGVGFSWIFLERGFISRGKTKINGKKVHSKISWDLPNGPLDF